MRRPPLSFFYNGVACQRKDTMNLSRRAVLSGLLSLPLATAAAISNPRWAYADTADELAAAQAQLEALGSELSAMQESLAEATTQLEQTDFEIAEKGQQIEEQNAILSEKQGKLGELMKSSYKSGETSLLDFVLNSTSFEDLVTRVHYLDSISESQAAAIAEVSALAAQLEQDRADLEEKQADQQEQVESLQSQVGEYEERVAEAQSVYNSLDAQLQAELEAQRNAELQAALDAANQGGSNGGTTGGGNQGGGSAGGGGGSSNGGDSNDGGGSGGSSSGGSGGHVPSGGGVATALQLVGSRYVYGATGPDAFDCSGLVCYCYGYARGRSTYLMIDSLKASGDWKTNMSQLNNGDLVFPHSGHVGIYLGGGQMVHAATPTKGVVIGSVYSFIGGGPY